jgi:hypothetical protein
VRVTVVQQAGEFLALGLPPLHRRLNQRFLDLAGHVAPYQRCSSQQTGQAVQSIRHIDLPRSLAGTAGAQQRSIAIIAKGDIEYGYLHQGYKIDGGPADSWSAGHLLRRAADPQIAAEDDREGDQPRSRDRTEEPPRRDK